MVAGYGAALTACALWALTFVAPEMVAPKHAIELTLLRYVVFGVSSIGVLVAFRFNPFRVLTPRDWARIVGLGLVGNSLYFVLIAAAVPRAGSIGVAIVLGALPVLITVVDNIRHPSIRWSHIVGPLLVIVLGIGISSISALRDAGPPSNLSEVALGLGLALAALLSWLIYGTWNAGYLRSHSGTNAVLWASWTGLGTFITLPLLLPLVAWNRNLGSMTENVGMLALWALILGVGASWIAAWMWNKASSILPLSILGLLFVFETLIVLLYSCILQSRVPTIAEFSSVALVSAGSAWEISALRRSTAAKSRPFKEDAATTVALQG